MKIEEALFQELLEELRFLSHGKDAFQSDTMPIITFIIKNCIRL